MYDTQTLEVLIIDNENLLKDVKQKNLVETLLMSGFKWNYKNGTDASFGHSTVTINNNEIIVEYPIRKGFFAPKDLVIKSIGKLSHIEIPTSIQYIPFVYVTEPVEYVTAKS